MVEETSGQKSLVAQILDEMFASVKLLSSFDAETIQKLKQLAMRGDLTEETQIIEAIQLASEETS